MDARTSLLIAFSKSLDIPFGTPVMISLMNPGQSLEFNAAATRMLGTTD